MEEIEKIPMKKTEQEKGTNIITLRCMGKTKSMIVRISMRSYI